jgi:acetylornithine deacetylase
MLELDKREQRILETVDILTEDRVDFTCRLVAEASTVGHEKAALLVMENELEKLGFSAERVFIDPLQLKEHAGFASVPWGYENRYNIAAVEKPAGTGGRSALFNGHLDVVSPEPLGFWQQDPFDPQIRDGWLYGRGAGDMKSGIAAMTYALYALKKAGFGLNGEVTLTTVIEEECSGNGALTCILAGYDAEAVLIPEPFGPTILTNQVGVLWFKVKVKGSPRHVQSAPAGTNAIEKSYLLIDALRRLEADLNQAQIPPAYRQIDHPLNLNVGMFRGGDWPSTVPGEAEFHGRLSYFPGETYADVCRQVQQTVAEAAKADPWLREHPPQVEFYGFRSDGHSVSRELPALAMLNTCHKSLTGRDADEYIATCTTDLRAFLHFGNGQATCYGPLAEHIHAANERVDLASVNHVARTYALFLARWCGLAE